MLQPQRSPKMSRSNAPFSVLLLCFVLFSLTAALDFPNAPASYLPGISQPVISAVGTFNIPGAKSCISARFLKNDRANLARLDYGFPDETFSYMVFANASSLTIVTKENDTMVCSSQPANFTSSLGSIPQGTWLTTSNISGTEVAQYFTTNPTRFWYYDVLSNPNKTSLRGWDQYWPEYAAPGGNQTLGRVWFSTINATAPTRNDPVWSPEKYCGKSAKDAATIANTDGPATRPRPSRKCPVAVGGCWQRWVPGYWSWPGCWGCLSFWVSGYYVWECTPVWNPCWVCGCVGWWCGR